MTMMRMANPPREIAEEADRLLDEWALDETSQSFEEYLSRHASQSVLAYMEAIADISDEEETEDIH